MFYNYRIVIFCYGYKKNYKNNEGAVQSEPL